MSKVKHITDMSEDELNTYARDVDDEELMQAGRDVLQEIMRDEPPFVSGEQALLYERLATLRNEFHKRQVVKRLESKSKG